jgi:hypothetical protein
MTEQEHPSSHPWARLVTWGLVLALIALPVVWLDVYLLATDDASAEYLVGRYSLLLGVAAAVMLVIERLRRLTAWAALSATARSPGSGSSSARVLDTGASAYPWVIAGAAVVAAVTAGMPGPHRAAAVRTAVLLAVTTGIGLLGLA